MFENNGAWHKINIIRKLFIKISLSEYNVSKKAINLDPYREKHFDKRGLLSQRSITVHDERIISQKHVLRIRR
jgi:hypothetical protein